MALKYIVKLWVVVLLQMPIIDRAFPTADGAIATTGVDDAIGQFKFKDDRATMA